MHRKIFKLSRSFIFPQAVLFKFKIPTVFGFSTTNVNDTKTQNFNAFTKEQTESLKAKHIPKKPKQKEKTIWKNNNQYKNLDIKRDLEIKEKGSIPFDKLDKEDFRNYIFKDMVSKEYVRIHDKWQKNLVKGRELKRKNKENFEKFVSN